MKRLSAVALVAASTLFCALVALIIYLGRSGVISVALAILSLVALLGLYVGFGVLIGAHALIRKLE